jgi:hypothetical protein
VAGGALAADGLLASLGACVWLAGTLDVALARIPEGPCNARDTRILIASSVAIPFVDVFARARVHTRFAARLLRAELARLRSAPRAALRAVRLRWMARGERAVAPAIVVPSIESR